MSAYLVKYKGNENTDRQFYILAKNKQVLDEAITDGILSTEYIGTSKDYKLSKVNENIRFNSNIYILERKNMMHIYKTQKNKAYTAEQIEKKIGWIM